MSLSLKDVIGVNRKHPLNRGRVCWWLCLPRTMGGRQWFDLMGKNHGTLTNMTDASISGWRTRARPGGAGCLRFDNPASEGDNRVAVGTVTYNIGTGGFTVAAWVNTDEERFSQESAVIALGTSNVMYCYASSGEFGMSAGDIIKTSGASLAAGTWYRLVASRRGTSLAFYVNGVAAPTSNTTSASIAAATVVIGDWNAGGSRVMHGRIDDVSIWNRGLSDAEVLQDYNLSRAGYPGVLLREGDYA